MSHYHPADVVKAARQQIGVTLEYDPSYASLSYPKGDIELGKGVCSDVVIRALRAVNIDLQKEIKESILKNPHHYKNYWGRKMPDSNIDHRRVPNLLTYFKLKRWVTQDKSCPRPGDFGIWKLPNGQLHIGVVSDKLNKQKTAFLIIHNICCGVKEEDIWEKFPLIAIARPPLSH